MLNMDTPVMMNTVWMLDDFSPEIGGTRVVPGSHKSGLGGPPEGFDVVHEIQPTAPAGSVIVFNGQCWHGGGANTSGERRRAICTSYVLGWLRSQENHFLHTTLEQARGWPERVRQLMGYDLYSHYDDNLAAGPLGYYEYRSPAVLFEKNS